MKKLGKNQFVSLHIDVLMGHSSLPVDIYIKLSENKYVKVAHAHEFFQFEVLDHFRKKGMNYFSVPEEDYLKFINTVAPKIDTQIKNSEGQTFCCKSGMQQTAVQLILGELFAHNYLTATTAQLLYTTLSQVIADVKKFPKLGEVLKCFMRRKDFLSGHSLQLAYICNLVLMKLPWHSNELMKKLSLASLLHDISLHDNNLAKVCEMQHIQQLVADEQTLLMNHPLQSTLHIAEIDFGFPDLDQIILSHHEIPGQGFPGRIQMESISKTAALFIMCEEFVTRINGRESDTPFLHQLKSEFAQKYDQGNFSEQLQGLLGLFDDMYYYSSVNCAG